MGRGRSNAISSKSPSTWGGGGKVKPSGSGPAQPIIGMQRAIGNQATLQTMADNPPETLGYEETHTSGGSSGSIPYTAMPAPETPAYNNVYDEVEEESEEASGGSQPLGYGTYAEVSSAEDEPAYNNVYDEIEEQAAKSEEASGGGSQPSGYGVYTDVSSDDVAPYNNVYDEIEEQAAESEEASGGGSVPSTYTMYTGVPASEEQASGGGSASSGNSQDAYTAPTRSMLGGNASRDTAASAPKPKPTAPYVNENGFEMKPMNPGMEQFDTQVQRRGVAFAPMQSTTHYMKNEEQRKDYARGFNEQGLMTNASSGEALNTIGALQAPAHGSKADRHIFTMDGEGQFHSADAVRETRSRGAQAMAEGRDTQERFHHSSFNAGEAVAGAGEMQVRDGQVELLSDTSGHYFPGSKQMVQTVQQLERNNVSMEKLGVEFNGKGRGENMQASALELLGYADHSPETAEQQMRAMHGKRDDVLEELRDSADGLDENSNLTPSEVVKQQKANKQASMQSGGGNNQPVVGFYAD
ncbi:hypothetical protein [Cohnella panacarvi]|uniref:hypothetical protein n=1 Tax=Cohnella panacarvi TaxID=400776 RepID=UPI00047EB860|nr:hypothetical protein [Cohnella panacarvi]